MFPFRMISDTRIECRHADSRWSGSPCAPVGARRGKELSREARVRLDCMDFYHRCRNVARTCRHFGISRQTFYRWHRRYNSYNLTTLEARSPPPSSSPPAHVVSPLADRVLALRHRYPRWGKDKLGVLQRQCTSRFPLPWVGRILTQMKRQGTAGRTPAHARGGLAPRLALPPLCRAVRKPSSTRFPAPVTCFKSIPWMFVRCPVSSSSSGHLAAPHALSHSRPASRRRLGVRRRVRAGLPATGPAPMATFIFKTGYASEYHRDWECVGVRGIFPYEAIFCDLLRAGNSGSRRVRSEPKTSYRPPH